MSKKVQELKNTHETVLLNVLTYNERVLMDYRQRKLEAYVVYRQWREHLNKHQEFVKNLKRYGVAALLPPPQPLLPKGDHGS